MRPWPLVLALCLWQAAAQVELPDCSGLKIYVWDLNTLAQEDTGLQECSLDAVRVRC